MEETTVSYKQGMELQTMWEYAILDVMLVQLFLFVPFILNTVPSNPVLSVVING